MIHVIPFVLTFAGCLIFSLIFGGKPERASALALLSALILTIFAILLRSGVGFGTLAHNLALIDCLLLLCLTGIALRANRLWTIVLAGLQLSLVLVHASKALYPALPAASYGIFAQFWAWPMIVTLAVGTRNHRERVRRFGHERDWKPLWPHSVQANSSATSNGSLVTTRS